MHGSARGLTHLTHILLTRLMSILPYSSRGVSELVWCVGSGVWVHYQSLPDPVPTVRTGLVLEVWTPATYQSLPASTCKGHWILVRSAAALPVVTMRYHVSILSLHRPLTFTNHHLRPDTHTDTHMEHTHIEHSRNTAQSEPSGTLDQSE